jgi:hypothetical protein
MPLPAKREKVSGHLNSISHAVRAWLTVSFVLGLSAQRYEACRSRVCPVNQPTKKFTHSME